MKLIDKAAVIAEIERRMKLRYDSYKTYNSVSDFIAWEELEYFKEDFLPTLEVKEVDLEKKINEWLLHGNITDNYYDDYCDADIIETANYFFELGLKTQKGE